MADKSQQTEQATQRRLKKAREDGQFPSARELVGAAQFLLFVVLLCSFGAAWFARARSMMRTLIETSFHQEVTIASLVGLGWWAASHIFIPLVSFGGVLMAGVLAVQLVSTGFGFSLNKLMPEFKRLSPGAKISGLPRQNIPALIQALIMLPVFGWAVYFIARDHVEEYLTLPLQTLESSIRFVGVSFHDLLYRGAAVFVVFGAVSFFRQKQHHATDLKMSKQEVRDESKESEGNPHTKQRIRRLQRDMRRRQMMREVPHATAVIVNPTHYAIAIKYSMESMSAPTVVAKGKNFLAARIRTLAISNQVPIIENPPLAQALYKTADVGQEIPAHLYRAVAEILAYIYKLMNRRSPI